MNYLEWWHTSGKRTQLKEALPYTVGAPQAVGEQGQKTERRGKVGETLPSSYNLLQTLEKHQWDLKINSRHPLLSKDRLQQERQTSRQLAETSPAVFSERPNKILGNVTEGPINFAWQGAGNSFTKGSLQLDLQGEEGIH